MTTEYIPHMSDDWTSTSWEAAFASANRLAAHHRDVPLRALQTIFPQSLTESLRANGHPVVGEQLWNVAALSCWYSGWLQRVSASTGRTSGDFNIPTSTRAPPPNCVPCTSIGQ